MIEIVFSKRKEYIGEKVEKKTKLHTRWFLLCELSNQNYLFENEKRMITEEMRGTRELRFDSPPLMFHWH